MRVEASPSPACGRGPGSIFAGLSVSEAQRRDESRWPEFAAVIHPKCWASLRLAQPAGLRRKAVNYMSKKIAISVSSEISNLGDDVDLSLIRNKLASYVNTLARRVNADELNEWRILVNIVLQNTDGIGVAKRIAKFPSDKEFGLYISIPIPDDAQAVYGLNKVTKETLKKKDEKYSYIMPPNFTSYDDLYSYILDSSKYTIEWIFSRGFLCGGKKIKLENSHPV
jgi:hypothetical protein